MNPRTTAALCAFCLMTHASPASAQWSSNPAANLSVADRTGEQTQSKIRATSDGGCYISWFDNATGGYDVYLQRLDRDGVEQWPHNGVLIADRSFSSTQDYGLAVDADDNAIIAYRDDRAGGIQVGVNKILPDGTLAWGGTGMLLTNTAEFIGNMKVAATTDGHYVVAWGQGASLRLQRLDADGATQWAAGGIAQTPGAGSYSVADVHPSLSGSVIVSWVHATGGFSAPRNLNAQRFDASGAALWNAGAPRVVFDGSSLQIGYFPAFTTDTAGGAIFSWYETGASRRVYVQQVLADGTERFAHNGVAGAVQAGRIGLSPDAAFDAANDDIYLFWTETTTLQNAWGLYGQRFRAGERQWGDNGMEIRPLDGEQESFVRAVHAGGVAMTFAFDRSSGAQVVGYGLDADGLPLWAGGMTAVCTNLTGKSRLEAAANVCGHALLTWGDGDISSRDILAQNIRPDGTLGMSGVAIPGDMNCDQAVTLDDVPLFVQALLDPAAYATAQPCCNALNGDFSMDEQLAGDDVAGFVAAILD